MDGAGWDNPIDLAMHLTFKDGRVFETGSPVGTYVSADDKLVVSIGEHCQLEIDRRPSAGGTYAGRLRTSMPGESDFIEGAALTRDWSFAA